MLVRPKTAVHFNTHLKILWTEVAALGSGGECQWAADPDSVAELERSVFNVLLSNEAFGNRPAFYVTAQNELRFSFLLLLEPSLCIRLSQIIVSVMVHDLK